MVTRLSSLRKRPRRGVDLRALRLPVEIRIEVADRDSNQTTRSKRLGMESLLFESGGRVDPGAHLNLLLYLPRGEEDLDLVRVQAEVTACDEHQGLYAVAAALRRFAPGDERRLRDWLLAQLAPARRSTT